MDFLQEELDEILNIFSQESAEILQSMDKNLLLLEKKPQDIDVAMHLFRDAHSLKGSARMLGFDGIQNIAHKIEDVLGLIREKKLIPDSKILDTISSALQLIENLIKKTVEQKSEYTSEETKEHIKKLEAICLEQQEAQPASEEAKEKEKKEDKQVKPNPVENLSETKTLDTKTEKIENRQEKTIIHAEDNQKEELKNFELIELINKTSETVPLINQNKHSLAEVKSLLNEIISRLNNESFKKTFQTVLSIVLNIEGAVDRIQPDSIEAIREILNSTVSIVEAKFSKNVFEDSNDDIDLVNQKASIVEQMVKFELQNPNISEPRKKSTKPVDWIQNIDTTTIKTLRVNSDKLDKLVNQIGNMIVARIKSRENISTIKTIHDELIELQKSYHKIGYYMKFFEKKYIQEISSDTNKMQPQKKDSFFSYNKQLVSFHNSNTEKLNKILTNLNLLMKEVQENNLKLSSTTSEVENMVKSMRILPLSTVFNLFPRMVHNIAKDNGKEIDIQIEGGDVSADKKIIEDIKIPIMHVVRNSIGHGIETPRERERAGKKRTGTIIIRASQRESKIIVSIKDDGRGIDIEKIKNKAIEKGLVTADNAGKMSREQIANFIFYPGFSTGDTVNDLSGRGLGLDIVQSKIAQLNGRVDVYSEENLGTVVTMELPTSMATMKTFIIMEHKQLFAIPAGSIYTVLRINPNEIKKRDKRHYFIYDDVPVPVCSLASLLGMSQDEEEEIKDKYTLMILKAEGVTLGVIVQKLIGDEEILNKKLPEPMLRIKNISGITTLANGEMCLLLNIGDILNAGKISPQELNTARSLSLRDNAKYKILVVDDSVTTRRLLYNILTGSGYNVQVESNAKNALRILDANKFDLIITDFEMPEMSGLDFLEIIRQRESTKNMKVFVLTSVDKQEVKDKFYALGVSDFIKKGDFNQKSFLDNLSRHLNFGR